MHQFFGGRRGGKKERKRKINGADSSQKSQAKAHKPNPVIAIIFELATNMLCPIRILISGFS